MRATASGAGRRASAAAAGGRVHFSALAFAAGTEGDVVGFIPRLHWGGGCRRADDGGGGVVPRVPRGRRCWRRNWGGFRSSAVGAAAFTPLSGEGTGGGSGAGIH
jgi:hypothetical protein